MDRKLDIVKNRAAKLGIDGVITESRQKTKRFAIKVNGRTINFGLWPLTGKGTFIDHGDNKIRKAWQARHREIKLADGTPAYKDKNSPEYYSWNLLW